MSHQIYVAEQEYSDLLEALDLGSELIADKVAEHLKHPIYSAAELKELYRQELAFSDLAAKWHELYGTPEAVSS